MQDKKIIEAGFGMYKSTNFHKCEDAVNVDHMIDGPICCNRVVARSFPRPWYDLHKAKLDLIRNPLNAQP